jgi:LysR family transcriptional regulator, transcriptional activator of the cysJI operon
MKKRNVQKGAWVHLVFNVFSLKVFLKVAESGSFTKAAESLFLSQPSVSFHIHKLEQEFKIPLFIRSQSDRIRLTAAGETLLKHAAELMRLEDRIARDMRKHSPAFGNELRIAVCSIIGEHLIPLGVGDFREAHPEISLSLSITKCEKVFNGLLDGSFDIGITGVEPHDRSLVKERLMHVPMILFEGAPTGSKKSARMALTELRNRRLILREKSSGTRIQFEKFLADHGIDMSEIAVFTESESNTAIIEMVKDGSGISILPEFMIREEIEKGDLTEISLAEGRPMQSFYLVYRHQDSSSLDKIHETIDFFLRNSRQFTASS